MLAFVLRDRSGRGEEGVGWAATAEGGVGAAAVRPYRARLTGRVREGLLADAAILKRNLKTSRAGATHLLRIEKRVVIIGVPAGAWSMREINAVKSPFSRNRSVVGVFADVDHASPAVT